MNTQFPFQDKTYQIIGACFEVYKEKGCGFLESVYQECLQRELALQGIPFVAQQQLALTYKGQPLTSIFITDIVCFGEIIVELKAVRVLEDIHRAQVQNYLKATGRTLGLLINFGHYPKIEIERIIAEKGRYSVCQEPSC